MTRLRSFLATLILTCMASAVSAQDPQWAEKMFDRLNIDFGTVARGADCTTQLKIHNLYQETIYIRNVSTSCGCSAAKPNVNQIASGQDAYVTISMDTKRFMRRKDSAVLITLSEPTRGSTREIRIPLTVYIRTDVVFTPGSVNFGVTDHGASADRKISVAYAGRSDWKILDVRSPKPYLVAKANEISRPGNGLVNYELVVTLSAEAPIGALREELSLVTDDQQSPTVPLPVEAQIEAEFSVQPGEIALGSVVAGQTKTMNVVVRGRKPFKIDKIECSTPGEAFKVRLTTDERAVHVLPLTFTAPTTPGDVDELFTIEIPGRSEPLKFRAKGKVVAATTP